LLYRSKRLIRERAEIAWPVAFHIDTDRHRPRDRHGDTALSVGQRYRRSTPAVRRHHRRLTGRRAPHDPIGAPGRREQQCPQRGKGVQRSLGPPPNRSMGAIRPGCPARNQLGRHRVADARYMKISGIGRFWIEHGGGSGDVWRMMKLRPYHNRSTTPRHQTRPLE
jgi:hypothetical protein